jgi:hypothetical protein
MSISHREVLRGEYLTCAVALWMTCHDRVYAPWHSHGPPPPSSTLSVSRVSPSLLSFQLTSKTPSTSISRALSVSQEATQRRKKSDAFAPVGQDERKTKVGLVGCLFVLGIENNACRAQEQGIPSGIKLGARAVQLPRLSRYRRQQAARSTKTVR